MSNKLPAWGIHAFSTEDSQDAAWDPHAKPEPFQLTKQQRAKLARASELAHRARTDWRHDSPASDDADERREAGLRPRRRIALPGRELPSLRPFANPASGKRRGAGRRGGSTRAKRGVAAASGAGERAKRGRPCERLPRQSNAEREAAIKSLLHERKQILSLPEPRNRPERRELRSMLHRNRVALLDLGYEV